ncbi:TMEM43 family protein [Inquilinus limosus]|uniref:Uncharacterized protein n=1 Tax=Inquilinus limosus TaxID=171674 RepID=A0A211ZPJ8_9PROT|nr:TMEM43 family protein [Inquilinus limosus]OWJ67017.1 hypothetical protein BWR60_10775 [Inquilinus limosus]
MPITLASRRLSTAVLVGVCACALALVAMAWGEVTARNQRRAIDATLGAIVDRGTRGLDPADEGRMVRIVGRLAADGPVTDGDTGFSAPGLALEREVEMWQDFRLLRSPGDRSGPDLRWSAIRIPTWRLEDSNRPAPDNPEFPFASHVFSNTTARIGGVPVDAGLARAGGFDSSVVSADALPALARRLPELAAGLDRDWVVLSATPAVRRIGDLRVSYRTRGGDRIVTAIGRQREGRLYREAFGLLQSAVLSGDEPAEAFLGFGVLEGPSNAQLWGRGVGIAILAGALAFFFLGGFRPRDPDAQSSEGTGWPLAASDALGYLPGPALVAVLILLLLPFAMMALPAAVALGFMAYWMAQNWVAMLAGTAAALALAVAALFVTARPPDTPPKTRCEKFDLML